jgi:hypothetical protein
VVGFSLFVSSGEADFGQFAVIFLISEQLCQAPMVQ